MDRQEVATVINAFDAAGLTTPAEVVTAEAFAAATAELARKLRAEPAPDLESATAATAAKLVDAAATHELMHSLKLAKATQLANIAEQRALQSWQTAASSAKHVAAFAAAFDAAADDLATAVATSPRPIALEHIDMLPVVAAADWAPIGALCTRLDALAAMRDRLAFWHGSARNEGTHSDRFEKLSRHLRVLDVLALTSPQQHLRVGDNGPAHWIAALKSDRVEVRWQDHTAQQANAKTLRLA